MVMLSLGSHTRGDVKWAVGFKRLEFRGIVKAGNINLDHQHIDVERGREEIFEGLALESTNLR